MCLSPVSLVPLAVELYSVYSELCPNQLTLLFSYYDEPKVRHCLSNTNSLNRIFRINFV